MRRKKLNLIQFIVYLGLFGSVGAVLNMLQISYPGAEFLKFDLSEVVVLVSTVINPLLGISVGVLKALLTIVFNQASSPIGVLSLIVGSVAIAIVFELLRKAKINLIINLIIVSLVFTFVMLLLNYFIVLPIFMNVSFSEAVQTPNYLMSIITIYLPFNIIKMAIVSIVYYVISKVLEKA